MYHCSDTLANTLEANQRAPITFVETQSERLKRLRKAAGLTQPALAKRAGVSQGTIGNIESGLRGYGESIVSIAAALNVSPGYLRCDAGAAAERLPTPTPAPPRDFEDRHEVSHSDWGALQDMKLVMSEADIAELRLKAERIRRIAREQLEELAQTAKHKEPKK